MKPSRFGELVLETLLRRVRVIAESQLIELNDALQICDSTRSELRRLERSDFVYSFSMSTKILRLDAPLTTWTPLDQREPDFWKLSWLAESRYKNSKPTWEKIFVASEKAERRFGGVGGSLRQPFQLVHDLGTAAIHVAFLRSEHLKPEWIGEDIIRRFYRHLNVRKIPDAALVADGKIVRAIEFAGRDYSGNYIRKFHSFWKQRKTPYEIW